MDSAGRGVMLNTGLALPAPRVPQRLRVSMPSPARATRLDMGIPATTTRSFTGTICSIQYRTTRELLIPWTAEWECIFHKAACVCPSIALNGFGITCLLLLRW